MQKPAVWVQIFGLGSTLICQEENVPWGFRAEQYRALRLFWPRDDFGALLPGEAQISDWYPRLRFANREPKQTIRECLELLSEGLAMELTQDAGESWQGWGGWEYLNESLS